MLLPRPSHTSRVINNIVKKCETKPRYVDVFGSSEGYPTEFPYRQRVIILFQV